MNDEDNNIYDSGEDDENETGSNNQAGYDSDDAEDEEQYSEQDQPQEDDDPEDSEDSEDEDQNSALYDDEDDVNPLDAKSIRRSSQSAVEWNMAHNSPIQDQFNTFNSQRTEPYRAAGQYLSEAANRIYGSTPNSQDFTEKQQEVSSFTRNISSKYGTSVRLSGTGIYNRTIRSSASTIGSNQSADPIRLHNPPRGLQVRPVARDWNTFQEEHKDFHMREAVFQLQESSYVGGLLSRGSNVRTEVITQGFDPVSDLSVKKSKSATKSLLGILGGNEVSLGALRGTNVEAHRVLMDNEGEQITPSFHPKLNYYYKTIGSHSLIQSASIGTQNRTHTLQNRNSMEEVLFLSMDMVEGKGGTAQSTMQRVLKEVASATDAMFTLQDQKVTAGNARFLTSAAFTTQTPSAQYVKLNKDIHLKRLDVLQSAARDRSNSKVVLSVQYLESNLFQSSSSSLFKENEEYLKYKQDFFNTLESLSQQKRLSLITTTSSKGANEGLFALYDRLNDPNQVFNLFGESETEAARTRQRILDIVRESAVVAPTKLKHSKGFAILNEEATELQYLEVSSANLSYTSFERNIEAGIFLDRDTIEQLGLGDDNTLRYYREGLMNKMSSDGIYVERKGNREQTRRAADMLLAMGGVETREFNKKAPFRFSRRYNARGEETGLDIVLKNQYSISVTVGSTQESRYDTVSGRQTIQEVPIIYINKGNRVITGMDWKNKSSRTVVVQSSSFDSRSDGKPVILTPGSAVSVDALQVLGGIVYTMNQGMAYEENSRVMYMGLKRLLEQGDAAALNAIQQTESSEQNAKDRLNIYKDYVVQGNIEEIAKRSREIRNVIGMNSVANQYYATKLKESKKDLFNRLIEIYPQSHELSYSHGQLMWKRPLYGLTSEVEDIHYQGEDTIISAGFLLSEMPIEHTEYMKDSQGLTYIRGASETARPSTLNQHEMVGGLIRVKGGVHTPYSIQLLNSMPGLSLFSYTDYQRRLRAVGINPDEGYGQRILETVFALEKRRMEEEEPGSWQTNKYSAVMLYTPFEKTEQNPQRFKNLKAIRNFIPANVSFANFIRSLGLQNRDEFIDNINVARNNRGDLSAQDIVGGVIPYAIPTAQFSLLKKYQQDNPDADLEAYARSIAIDTDETTQGFINAPKRGQVSMGISEMNDYSFVNTALANSRENAYFKTYRAQAALSTNELDMTATEFNALLSEKLQVGTMFVARDKLLTPDHEHFSNAYYFVRDKINEVLRDLDIDNEFDNPAKEVSIDEVEQARKEMLNRFKQGDKAYSFIKAIDIKRGRLALKKGVYQINSLKEGWLNRIGGINEGDNAFYIDDLQTYKSLGSKSRIQPFKIKAPAYSGRELGAISVLYKTPVAAEQDQHPGMVTYNFEMVDISELRTGQRSATAKGPFVGKQRDLFLALGEIYESEVKNPYLSTEEEVFFVIASGQMKGYVFEAGLGLLREGEQSPVWQAVADRDRQTAGYKVAEALSLMMLGDQATSGDSIVSLLQSAYKDKRIDNRRQASAALARFVDGRAKAKKVAKKDQSSDLARDFSPTIALYEGLMSLADTQYQSNQSPEQALIDTVSLALQNTTEGAQARTRLAESATRLFEQTKANYAIEYKRDKYTYDETLARSGSALAYYLNAAQDLLGDINKEKRLSIGGLSEVGYSGGFIGQIKDEVIRQQVTQEINTLFHEYRQEHQQTPQMDAAMTKAITNIEDRFIKLLEGNTKTVDNLFKKSGANNLLPSELRKGLREIVDKYGGLSATELILTTSGDDAKTAAVFREAATQQTYALGLELPNLQKIWELKDQLKRNNDKIAQQRLQELMEELELTLYSMRTVFQFEQKMNVSFDMTLNKITVPTGMEDTTSLEGHYANALTQRQLELYTYSGADKEKATTLQQTMVILGSMLQEGLGSSLDQTNLNQLYSIRRTSAILLGLQDWEERDVNDPTLTREEREKAIRRNRLRIPLSQEIESQRFSFAFSEAYGVFTSQSRANVFPSLSGRKVKDIAPAEELFFNYVQGQTANYQNALGYMKWAREVSSGKSNLSTQERAAAITKDYLRRLKNNETIVGGQVDTLLRGIKERSLAQLQQLSNVTSAIFESTPGTEYSDAAKETISDWVENLSEAGMQEVRNTFSRLNIQGPASNKDEIRETIYNNKARLSTLSEQRKQAFASLGFNDLRFVLTHDTNPDEIDNLSIDRKRSAFIQLLVRDKVKKALQSGSNVTLNQAISQVQSAIDSGTTVAAQTDYFINTAEDLQQRLLEGIISNEVNTKLKRAKDILPGKEYIEGRQKLRKYAQAFLSTSSGDEKQRQRAQSLIDTINKTYSVKVPILQFNPQPDEQGQYKLRYSSERNTEGWVLGLDVLERMSLVFPGHTHEALQAQYNLMDSLSLADEEGVFEALAEAAETGEDVTFNSTQLQIYRDLVQHSEKATEQILELSKNKETFRKTMADRLTMTGASFIGVNSYLVRSTEVALGTRIDSLVKDNSGAGIRNLFDTMSSGLLYHHRNVVEERQARLTEQLNATDPSDTQQRDAISQQLQAVGSRLELSNLDPNIESERKLLAYGNIIENVLKEIARALGKSDDDVNAITLESLLQRASIPNPDYTQAILAAQQAQANQAALQNQQQAAAANASATTDPVVNVNENKYGTVRTVTNAFFDLVGGEAGAQGAKKIESLLFRSAVLVARQGAPSGTFHTYGSGHQQISMEEYNRRAGALGSLLKVDLNASSTGMFISSTGNQFTQLGDYDGDSFQAAFTKLSSSAKELAEANTAMLRAEREYYAALENEQQDPTVSISTSGAQIQAFNDLQSSVEDFVSKVTALRSLQVELEQQSSEKVRGYISDFMSIPKEFLEGDETTVGAIKDYQLRSLVKQYRDTESNLYGNRDKIESLLPAALAKLSRISLTQQSDGSISSTIVFKGGQQPSELQDTLTRVAKDYGIYAEDSGITAFNQMSLVQQRKELIEFGSMMAQKQASLGSIDKIKAKMTGSLLNSAALSNVQAIVGSTGTGLLGKTYNTVVPLLGLAAADLAAMRTMRQASEQSVDTLGTIYSQALQQQQTVLTQRLSQASDPQERESIEQQLNLVQGLATASSAAGRVPYALEEERLKSKLNTTFGLMLDVQQFLRDAGLKPKEGGSVALEAAVFEYSFQEDGVTYTEKGLDRILERVGEEKRTEVMTQFIGTRAATVLAADYGFDYQDGKVTINQAKLDSTELRAFAALEMVNEYLSGKLSATQMMQDSAFAGFFRQRKEFIQKQDPTQPPPTDEYVVESTIADSLAKFRTEFIYNSVLEGDNYASMLEGFNKDLIQGYTQRSIDQRAEAYEQKVRSAYGDVSSLSQAQQNVIKQDIITRTEAWKAEEERRALVMRTATQRAADLQNRGVDTTPEQEVFKAILEYEHMKQSQSYVGTNEEPGLFSSLRSLNVVVSGLQQDRYATPGTAQQFEIAQTAILYNIARGKLDGTTLNESIFRLASEVQRSDSSAEAVGALLSIGGATSLPGLMEFIQSEAVRQAGGDTSKVDDLVRQSLITLGDILTTKVDVDGTQRSYAEVLAEKSVVSASSSRMQQEINELNMMEANVRQKAAGGDYDLDIDEELDTMFGSHRRRLEQNLEDLKKNPRKAANYLNDEFDVVGQALNDLEGQVNENIAKGMRDKREKQKARAYTSIQEKAHQAQVKTSTLSLLAIPLLFSLVSEEVTLTERVADLTKSVIETALTLSMNESSIMRQFLLGEGSGVEIAQGITKQIQSTRPSGIQQRVEESGPMTRQKLRSIRNQRRADRLASTALATPPQTTAQTAGQTTTQTAAQTTTQTSTPDTMQTQQQQEQLETERRVARNNYLLQVARAKEFIFNSDSRVEGVAQAVAFEALNIAGSYAASNFANNTRLLRDDNIAGRAATEVVGGVVGMALAGVVTQRPIVGTNYTHDFAFEATVEALANIRNNVLAASNQALSELVNGADVDITDGYTGESLDAILAEGDIQFDDDNTSISAVERLLLTEGMLEEEESIYTEVG